MCLDLVPRHEREGDGEYGLADCDGRVCRGRVAPDRLGDLARHLRAVGAVPTGARFHSPARPWRWRRAAARHHGERGSGGTSAMRLVPAL
jgi:hypothetical protein